MAGCRGNAGERAGMNISEPGRGNESQGAGPPKTRDGRPFSVPDTMLGSARNRFLEGIVAAFPGPETDPFISHLVEERARARHIFGELTSVWKPCEFPHTGPIVYHDQDEEDPGGNGQKGVNVVKATLGVGDGGWKRRRRSGRSVRGSERFAEFAG